MGSFLEFSKSSTFASQRYGVEVSSGSRAVAPIDLIRQEMQHRKEQCCRLSAYIVRVTVGNESTDYQLPYQPGEVLWAVDYNRLVPVTKFFGRFQGGRFTGLRYHYSYFFEDNQSRQYVECIAEYRDGRPQGMQVYFDAQGEVTRRTRVAERVGQLTP
ncbi:MAG: hypothetical protein ICV83_15410 [Cytophagales bacterium]|nr:hypothetical protein [Cytophagales bacterium]